MTTTQTQQQETPAEQNARGWAEAIEAWSDAIDFCTDEDAEGRDLSREAKAVLREHGYDGTNREETVEAIEETARESALSVDVRSGWQSVGETLEPEAFQILLSTGGPALRVVGQLDRWKGPCHLRLEHQDWGTPWTEWHGTTCGLQAFCQLFFFGE
jgi:hypothetical protein